MQPNDYADLRQFTDKAFQQVEKRHPGQITCSTGCHACCSPGLTVGARERREIANWLSKKPRKLAQAQQIEANDPHRGQRCSFLSKAGKCVIYEVRPITCRSHGAPLAIAKDGYFQIDVCELNFKDKAIESLPKEDFFILDDLHAWVGFFNGSNRRFDLSLQGILGDDD